MSILEPMRTTYRVVWVFIRFVGTPRSGICCRLGPGTHPTGTRDQKVLTMCILEHLGTTYRVIWGISTFVGTLRHRIFFWLGPGTHTTGIRDPKM